MVTLKKIRLLINNNEFVMHNWSKAVCYAKQINVCYLSSDACIGLIVVAVVAGGC